MSLHRARAKRNVRLAQISALGLVGLAGLLAAMPPPSPLPPKAAPLDAPAPPGPTVDTTGLDIHSVKGVFDLAARRESLVASAPAPEIIEEPDGTLAEPPVEIDLNGPPHIRYVGLVSSPRRSYALIVDHQEKSQWIAPGEYIGEYSLLAVSSEKLILSNCDDSERHEYHLELRPDTVPSEAMVDLGGKPPTQAATTNPQIYNPSAYNNTGAEVNFSNGINEQLEREQRDRIDARMREFEENKKKQLSNTTKPATVPPNRAAPVPSPKPATSPNRNTPAKEKDSSK